MILRQTAPSSKCTTGKPHLIYKKEQPRVSRKKTTLLNLTAVQFIYQNIYNQCMVNRHYTCTKSTSNNG